MTSIPSTQTTDGVPTYLRGGDPSVTFADYYPAWIDRLTGDVTLVAFSRLLRERFAGTPYAEHFLAGEA